MTKIFQKALFIFRRDLRLEDNTGLIFALKNAKSVICCFIFTPEQVENNPYKSNHCLQFMIESLEDLNRQLKNRLYLFYGSPDTIIEKLDIDAVICNKDYTPYSLHRDQKIEKACKKSKIAFYSFDDATLHPVDKTLKTNEKPYTIFTPFYRNAMKFPVDLPVANTHDNYYSEPILFAQSPALYKKILPIRVLAPQGGRSACLAILQGLKKDSFSKDYPASDATSHLSAHLKFTTCSSREIYFAISKKQGSHSDLIRSLYWRDFFTSIAFYFPHVFSGSFHKKFDHLSWDNNPSFFKKWCEGKTGFPIVDAGMRQMNQTGFMHNRVRMIVASFLVKDLHIDWRWGEKYFAQTLIDYDPALNNGNWQWAASTGCDAQPYFRIFNPWTQTLKFDPDCLYIKRYVPELSDVPSSIILKWNLQENHYQDYPDYPPPIVDHSLESKKAIASYKKASHEV